MMMKDETKAKFQRRAEALGELWDWFNELRTWKPVAVMLALTMAGVDRYNDARDERRIQIEASRAARHADLTNRLERIEHAGMYYPPLPPNGP